ncbi:MFS transporter [Wenjunlia tyrosinilytica]|uniref:MFS transporter n=1 Tax=Wenjunlia tyrosinilytica TaxID=1544741 RepID=A0A918E081_9ACTN|nr:MFS transporter [Wenjunlia tyrosinilytica]GGO92436.1 MFS transporter [Wenjunlia tyrosinilytica]
MRSSPPLWRTIVATSVPMFMVVLDNLVVTTALPAIRTDLNASLQDLQWFVSAYVLSFATLLLTGAALGDRYGRRRVFVAGISLFTASSLLAGLSTSSGMLIFARALQGAGGAMVMPLSLTLLAAAAGPGRRALAVGVWGAISGAAVSVGPVVGGAVTDGLDWQSIFWLNIPIGLLAIPFAYRTIGESKGSDRGLDLFGLLLAGGGVFSLVWGIVRAETQGWSSTETLTTITLGAVLLIAFVVWERRAKTPMLPLRFYRNPAFSLTNLLSMAMYFGVFGSIFLLSQFLQIAQGYSALEAGLRTLPWTLMPAFVAPVAGILTPRVGGGPLMAAGLVLQATGLGWLALILDPGTSYSSMLAPFVLAGTGMGLVFAPSANVVLGAVRPSEHGKASGANSTVREIGGALGISVLGAVFAHHGGYTTPQTFTDGLTPAVWVGVAVVAVGALLAVFVPKRRPLTEDGEEAAPGESATVERTASLTLVADGTGTADSAHADSTHADGSTAHSAHADGTNADGGTPSGRTLEAAAGSEAEATRGLHIVPSLSGKE